MCLCQCMAAVCTICLLEIQPRVFIQLAISLFATSETSAGSALSCDAKDTSLSSHLSHEKHMSQLKVNIKTAIDGKIYCCLLKSYWLCVSNVTFNNNWFMREITSGDWNSPRRQMLFLILKTKQFLIIFSPTVLNILNEEKLAETFPSPCDICLLWVGQLWRFVMYKDVYKPTEFHIRGTINMSNCNFKNALKVRHFMRYMLAFIW